MASGDDALTFTFRVICTLDVCRIVECIVPTCDSNQPKETQMDYSVECKLGRDHATHAIADCRATGDLPRLVRAIRDAAKEGGGYSVGFLFALTGEVTR